MKTNNIIGAVAFSLILSACGGDGGDSSAPEGGTNGGVTANTGNAGVTANTANAGGSTASGVSLQTNLVLATPAPDVPPGEEGSGDPGTVEGNFFFFSYDDSGSTASKDLAVFSIQNGRLPQTSLGRSYEYLSAEEFSHFDETNLGPFEVSMGLHAFEQNGIPLDQETLSKLSEEGGGAVYALGVNLTGPIMTTDERPNVVLTILVDISGSMSSSYANETRSDISSLLDVTKYALSALPESLKDGDEVNIVTFNHAASIRLESDTFDEEVYQSVVESLSVDGSTNLDIGIEKAYEVANRQYKPDKSNRVVIITDAYANTGVVDPEIISQNTTINNAEGIYFAGIGVGSRFNDAFLNELTDIGKGVYSAMITPEDGRRIFTQGFSRFLDHAVSDVRFRLEFPNGFSHLLSAAEEVSSVAADVQTINFSFNDSQFFFELFSTPGSWSSDDEFILEVSYVDSEGERVSHELTQTVDTLLGAEKSQIYAAAAVSVLARLVSGAIGCTDVTGSALYSLNVEDAIFDTYKGLIDQYCSI